MSLKSRFLTIFTAAAATAAFATFTTAQENPTSTAPEKMAEKRMKGEGARMGGKDHFGKRRGMMGMHMGGFHGIELTDAQKEQIKAIRQANKPTGAHRDELKTIAQARKAGTITEAQKERAQAIRQEMAAHRENVNAQVMAVLTAEQKAQIEQRRAEMQQKRQEFRQKRQELRKKQLEGKPAVTTDGTI